MTSPKSTMPADCAQMGRGFAYKEKRHERSFGVTLLRTESWLEPRAVINSREAPNDSWRVLGHRSKRPNGFPFLAKVFGETALTSLFTAEMTMLQSTCVPAVRRLDYNSTHNGERPRLKELPCIFKEG